MSSHPACSVLLEKPQETNVRTQNFGMSSSRFSKIPSGMKVPMGPAEQSKKSDSAQDQNPCEHPELVIPVQTLHSLPFPKYGVENAQ